MRGARTTIGLAATALLAALVAAPAQAGCTLTIINKSALSAVVSRDSGPWVRIPPHSSQSIRLEHPGTVHFALYCGGSRTGLVPPPDDRTLYRGSFRYMAIIDRCYVDFSDGFFTDYLGGGFLGFAPFRSIKPLTLNNPRQGDVIIGPRLDEACPILERALATVPTTPMPDLPRPEVLRPIPEPLPAAPVQASGVQGSGPALATSPY